MIVSISPVTYVCPTLINAGGWSETLWLGTTHDTAGSWFLRTALKNELSDWMLPSWWSLWTVSKYRSGSHEGDEMGPLVTGEHDALRLLSQAGSMPLKM